jgi:hypothetical protein
MPEFITKSQAQIVADYTRDIRIGSGEDTREGSHAYANATAVANAVMPSYVNAGRSAAENHPATASEEGIQRFANIYGPSRQSARKATGSVQVVSTVQTTIVAGTRLTNQATGEKYTVSKSTLIPSVSLTEKVYITAVPQPTKLIVRAEASVGNPFAVWPPKVDPANTASWYSVTSSTSTAQMVVTKPTSGTPVNPQAGQVIGAYFPSVGFAKATILNVVTTVSDWTLTVSSWSPAPTETTVPLEPITPWCSQLPLLAGAPVTGSKALSGAVPDFFSRLGPGEMVTLTSALTDKWRRRRDPFIGSINPMTGEADWPVGLTTRLGSAITRATDWVDASFAPRAGYTTTPAIGIPPSILTLASIAVFPV